MFKPFILFLYRALPASGVKMLGKSRLLKPLRNSLLRGKDGETLATVQVQWQPVPKSFLFRAPLLKASQASGNGIEPHLLRAALQLMQYNPAASNSCVVIDVGASYGFLSCVLAQSVCLPAGKVYAFEPHPFIHRTLQETIQLNKWKHVEAIQAATGNNNTDADLYLLHDSSNLHSQQTGNQKTQVKVITLDSFVTLKKLTHCHLLKIDVDGSELDVLMGAQQLIRQFKPLVICESNQNIAVAQFLKQAGYTLMNEQLQPIEATMPLPHDIIAVAQ